MVTLINQIKQCIESKLGGVKALLFIPLEMLVYR